MLKLWTPIILILAMTLTGCASAFESASLAWLEPTDASPMEWRVRVAQQNLYGNIPHLEMAIGKNSWVFAPGHPIGCGWDNVWYTEGTDTIETGLKASFMEKPFLSPGVYRVVSSAGSFDESNPVPSETIIKSFYLSGLSVNDTHKLLHLLKDPTAKQQCNAVWQAGFGSFLQTAHPDALHGSMLSLLEGLLLTDDEKWWILRIRREIALEVWLAASDSVREKMNAYDVDMDRDGKEFSEKESSSARLRYPFSTTTYFQQDGPPNLFKRAAPGPHTQPCQDFHDKLEPFLKTKVHFHTL